MEKFNNFTSNLRFTYNSSKKGISFLDLIIRRFPVQTPLGAWPGVGTQPRYEAPGDLRVESEKRSDWHRLSKAAPSIMVQRWL